MIKLILFDQLRKKTSFKNWLFIGSDFCKLQECKEKILGERILLNYLFKKEMIDLRPKILNWMACQSQSNNDSIHWWMTHFAGRNNVAIDIFLHILQISTLKNQVLKKDFNKDILIICEDAYIYECVLDNIKVSQEDSSVLLLFLKKNLSHLNFVLLGIIAAFKETLKFIIYYWYSFITGRKKIDFAGKDLHIFHQCLDDKSFLVNENLRCRYFMDLPDWMELKGKNVVRVPWLFNVNKPLYRVFKKLRKSNALVPYDWLNIIDFAISIKNCLLSCNAIKLNIPFDGLKINTLLKREKYKQYSESFTFIRFWLYKPFFEKALKESQKINFYSSFEMLVHEHIQAFFIHSNFNKSSKVIGYYHTLMSSDFLGHYFPKDENNSIIFPDIIITNGPLPKKILIERGIEKNKIIIGPKLRQNLSVNSKRKHNSKNILVPLPLSLSATKEVMINIKNLIHNLNKDLEIVFKIKPHPMVSKAKVLNSLDWKNIPSEMIWTNQDIDECLQESRAAITFCTGSIIDVVLSKTIPIPIMPELNQPWNNLDFLEDKFHLLRPLQENKIKGRIVEIFNSKSIKYDNELDKIIKILEKSFSSNSENFYNKILTI